MKTGHAFTGKLFRRSWKVQALSFLIVLTLISGILMITAASSPVSATSAKTKVTLTINMGRNGSDCPALYFYKGSKSYLGQSVSKWYIDGKLVKDPWGKFYKKSWNFKKHKVKVVMSIEVPKGTYKVVLDNGKKTKTLYSGLKIGTKSVKKGATF